MAWSDLTEGALVDVKLIKDDDSGIWVSAIVVELTENTVILGRSGTQARVILEIDRAIGEESEFRGKTGKYFEIRKTELDRLRQLKGLLE